MATSRKPATKAKSPAKSAAPPIKKRAAEQTHRQRFDQLLDDVVFGKPAKSS
jgi:hypothetical protein